MLGTALLLVGLATAAEVFWSVDLDKDDGGLISYGETGQWDWGTPSVGPKGGVDGSACWATALDNWYLHDTEDFLQLPSVDLADVSWPVLVFEHWFQILSGDSGCLELRTDKVWTCLEPIYGYPGKGGYSGAHGYWSTVYFDLSGVADANDLRLAFRADGGGAGPGWYVDALVIYDGSIAPPTIELDACLTDTEDLEGPYPLEVQVTDDLLVESVSVRYSVDGGEMQEAELEAQEGSSWTGAIDGQALGSEVSYQVHASDGQNESFEPKEACSFTVRLPAPTELSGPEDLVWGPSAELSWQAPESEHALQSYSIHRDGSVVATSLSESVDAPLVSGEQSFQVSASFDVGESGLSEALTVQAAVPAIQSLEPTEGYQEDYLRLALLGEYLLMQASDLQFDLGEGIEVEQLDVRDVDLAYITVSIDADAPTGNRDLVVTSGEHQVELAQAFEVLPGESRPQLTGLEPDTVSQGQEESLTITSSHAFAALPSVYLGEDILVESVELLDELSLLVQVAVPYSTPLGLHDAEVDDGVRVIGGAQLLVRDNLESAGTGRCAALPTTGRPWSLGLLAALAWCARRCRAERSQVQRRRPPSTGMLVPRT